MKPNIHPKYVEARVVCACGNAFATQSVKPELHVEACAKCHPFYTGKQNILDVQGRVERFNKRYANKAEKPAAAESAPAR